MSYNIDNFKVKKLENFRIPLSALSKKAIYGGYDKWFNKPEVDFETNEATFYGNAEDCEFKGIVKDGYLEVSDIYISGEGSGYFMTMAGESVLKNSTGTLIATIVWENGDSIERLTITDGVVEKKDLFD